MFKIIVLNVILLTTASSYNMDDGAARALPEYEKLLQHVINTYKINEDEARQLLSFCNDLQGPEDFKKHPLRQDFEYHLRNLLRNKIPPSYSEHSSDLK